MKHGYLFYFQVAKIGSNVTVSQFNWTEYFNNLAQLQTLFGAVLQSQVSLGDFFLYNGDMNSWFAKFNSIVMPNMDTAQWLGL